MSDDAPLTEATVRLAYRLMLGRPAESDEMVRYFMGLRTVGRLRDAFLDSTEFEFLLDRRPRLVRPDAPPLPIDWHTDDADALAMLAAVRSAWATAPPQGGDGAQLAADFFATLHRNGLVLPDKPRGFELGCGTGRVARHLAPHFSSFAASDAVPLQAGVTVHPAVDLRFGMVEKFDVWYSYHALHHSPPPLAARVLARAFSLLCPGGIAVFQAITYSAGYAFPSDAPRPANPYDDRHVLPQPAVFALARDAGCEPVEIFEDLSVAPSALWRSTMFVLRKPA
jgi:SAM-dependent methyltransferase